MGENQSTIALQVRELLGRVIAVEDPRALEDTTPLITGGVLDSIRTVQLISELEQHFNVSFEAYEMSVDFLDTISLIAATVSRKKGVAPA
jgi:acyl carrier protein